MTDAVATPQSAPPPAEQRKPERKGRRMPAWAKWLSGALAVLILAIVIFLMWFDWNMLRGPIGRYLSHRMERTVELRGDLNVHPFSWSPRAEINDLYIADTSWSGKPHMARVQRIEVSVKLLPLLRGQVTLPRLAITKPDANLVRNAKGLNNWTFGKPDKEKKPGKLPVIQQLVVDTGRIRLNDAQREITLDVTVSTREEQGREARFRLRGDGTIQKEPFTLAVIGGPLLNVSPDTPYPFDANVQAGRTKLTARGEVTKPFDLARIQARFSLEGPDLNQLYGLTGLALPNTPPYKVSGRLSRDETLYRVRGLAGRVGDSDIGGVLSVETKGRRPLLTADLTSRRLDFDDLATVFGGAPDARETASAEQKAVAATRVSSGRLLPDATLQVDRIRAMDADVKYRATSILAPGLPLKDVALAVDLKNGLLKVSDLALNFPQGRLTGTAQLDARSSTPLTDVDFRVTGLALQQFLTKTGASPVTGNLVARAKLSGAGNSVRRAAATADGSITVVVPRGEVREAFAELIGINVIKGLGLLFSKDTGRTELSCAIADFRVVDGVARSSQLLADTDPVLVTGGGMLSLRDETMSFELKGNPKKLRLVSLNAPVTISGPIRKPKVGVRPGGAIAQAGIGAALLAIVHPIAAILPFVDPGLAKDANCSALLSGARGKGAPVTKGQVARR